MKYWNSPQDMGLSEEQVTEILERLIKDARANATKRCPDCAVAPGKIHMRGCDVARCERCNTQALSCGCKNSRLDSWSGLWPGSQECYDRRLIAYSDPSLIGGTGWIFDYNTLAVIKSNEKQ